LKGFSSHASIVAVTFNLSNPNARTRQALLAFKAGAFFPGKPVQPVLLRYPNATDTVTWTWRQSHGVK
jgi:hypothetical protein